jgi:outer membrane protein TolC
MKDKELKALRRKLKAAERKLDYTHERWIRHGSTILDWEAYQRQVAMVRLLRKRLYNED